MNMDFLAFTAFVAIATFTPGPGNIASAGLGMRNGYRGALNFIIGMTAGYFLIMTVCAFFSALLLQVMPKAEPVLRVIGALYILSLAWGTLRSGLAFSSGEEKEMRFRQGFLIQALNPKAVIFGMTIYTTFLLEIGEQPFLRIGSILFLSMITFLSVSLWALGGAGIKAYLHRPGVNRISSIVLTVLLVYCAIAVSGLV